jgi:hypothetical protein
MTSSSFVSEYSTSFNEHSSYLTLVSLLIVWFDYDVLSSASFRKFVYISNARRKKFRLLIINGVKLDWKQASLAYNGVVASQK